MERHHRPRPCITLAKLPKAPDRLVVLTRAMDRRTSNYGPISAASRDRENKKIRYETEYRAFCFNYIQGWVVYRIDRLDRQRLIR